MAKERPANSRVRHGSPSCARYGCGRAECREAIRRYKREIYKEHKDGFQFLVPVDPSLDQLRLLLLADMSAKDISTLSGVDEKVIVSMLRGDRSQIHWTTEEALLGVKVPDEGWVPNSDGMIASIGAMRRLQALAVQGFAPSVLSEESGLHVKTIRMVRAGDRPRILISRNRVIRNTHDRLWDTDPLSLGIRLADVERARQYAEAQKWYPTEAWEDIDDPDCKPIRRTPRYVALTEDAEELMREQGYSSPMAAERLGVKPRTLRSARSHYRKVVGS